MAKILDNFPEGFWAIESEDGLINISYEESKIELVYKDGKFIGYKLKCNGLSKK